MKKLKFIFVFCPVIPVYGKATKILNPGVGLQQSIIWICLLLERVFLHEYKSIDVQTSHFTSLYVYTFYTHGEKLSRIKYIHIFFFLATLQRTIGNFECHLELCNVHCGPWGTLWKEEIMYLTNKCVLFSMVFVSFSYLYCFSYNYKFKSIPFFLI